MRYPLFCVLSLVLVAWMGAGCSSPEPVTYQPRIELDDLTAGLTVPDNDYCLLKSDPTQGRFACSLAIAEFAPVGGEDSRELALVPMKTNQEAYWADQLRGLPGVRDALFLSPFDVRAAGPGLEGLCASAGGLDASLLLAYAPSRFGPNAAQVVGVLYDVEERVALATLHASARFIEEEEGEEIAQDNKPGDHRDTDAAYQAGRAFERHAMVCLQELMSYDTPPPTTQPHQWETPREDRWWVPRVIRRP
ncbi:MAG: hypothetical protein KKB50_04485 [Planctomycetes bacterium]|nr:hypothetical protein [Planctomycetota bacterium]